MREGNVMQTTPYANPAAKTGPEDKSTDEVRQGTTGHNVRYVLAISLVAALAALAVAWVWVT